MLNWFAILLVVASFGIIVQMLRVFPAKNTPIYVYAFVFIGWFLPFVTIALVPYDVYVTLSGDGPKEFIYVAWDVLYWIIQSFCWLILPLLKRFMTAGEFTFLYKVRRALLNQLRYFMFLIAFLMIFIVYLAIVGDLNKSSLQTFLTALGSLWGMLLIIILMGYGVVAIPRLWWYKGDLEKSLNYLRLKAVTIDEQRIDVNYALDQLILAAIAYEKQVKNDEKLGVYMKKIMDRCPEEELEMNRTRTYNLPETGDATYQKLVNLNSNLKNTKLERIRLECRWEQLLIQAFRMEDIIKNKENTDKYIRSELWPEKTGKAARFREVSEWYWHTRVFPIFARILAVIFAICSIFVVLGETTLYVKQKDISFFPIFFKNEHGDVGTQILCMFPLTYIFATTYIGLFTLRIKGSYGLFNNNHTDPANLVWSAFFTARMVHPLIYNFLYFIKVENTQFNKVMGELNLVPYFGEVFIYFPLLIVFFALLNVLDFYTWFMVKLGIPQLGFSDNFDRQRLDEGKLLLGKSRNEKQRGFVSKVVYKENAPIRSISMSKSAPSRYDEIKNRKNPLKQPLN